MAYAQNLEPDDVIAMLKSTPERIDSLLKAKGFKEVEAPQDSTATGVIYVYQAIENKTKVQRLLVGGRHHHPDYVEWQYSVWQEKDALDWTNQLLNAAFKKTVAGTFVPRGEPSITSVEFQKADRVIYCEEQMDRKSGRIVYKFVISTEYYKTENF
jgi:hypothetical protein